jgi:hypothetical protein
VKVKVKVKMKVKKEKKLVVQVQLRECDGGSWDCVRNCTRRCNNGGEFASEEGYMCGKKNCLHQNSTE